MVAAAALAGGSVPRSDGFRRFVLATTALVFVLIAARAMTRPDLTQLGRHLDTVDQHSEFRAVYLGLWLATAVMLVIAAQRIRDPLPGDLGALLILGQVFGRLVSLVVDGLPGRATWSIFALELLGGVVILVVRPETRTDTHTS